MLAQTVIVALLAAAPALVHAAPTIAKTATSVKDTNVKVNSVVNNIKIVKPAGKNRKTLKIETKARKTRKENQRLKAALSAVTSPFGTASRVPPSPYGYLAQYSPSYIPPTPYGYGYPPQPVAYNASPIVSPGYNYNLRRDTILSPRSPAPELSPRAPQTPQTPQTPRTPLEDLGVLSRARIGLPGGGSPVLPPAYMRKGAHYKRPKAIHRNYGDSLQQLERVLEAAEKVVNGIEEQLNKPKTLFPELEAVERRMQKAHRSKMAAAAKIAAVKPATPAPAKSG